MRPIYQIYPPILKQYQTDKLSQISHISNVFQGKYQPIITDDTIVGAL